jgi:type I restriction enzyme S subunit
MNAETFCEHFATFADAPNGIAKLRALILQLAVQGKLVPQDRDDQPASALITAIVNRKAELIRSGQIPNESALPAISQDDVPFRLPSNWKWIRLETVCEAITKGSSPKWQGIQYVDASDGVLFVTSENVGNYVLRKMDEPKFVERRFNEMEPRSILQRDDVLVNLVGGSIGRSALFDRDDVANINQAVGIIRLVRGETSIDRWYLLHYLNSPISLRIMLEEQVETARANLSLTNMKHFLVPLPPLAEQRRIVEKVDQLLGLCDELAARQAAQREKRQRLVGATLDRLVSPDTSRHLACRGGLTASAPLDENTTGAKANEPPWQARWRVMQDDAHRLRNHFDQLFDTPTTIPQLRQTILQLAVQGQLVPQDSNDEPAEDLLRRIVEEKERLQQAGEFKLQDGSIPIADKEKLFSIPQSWKWVRAADLSFPISSGSTPAKDVFQVTSENGVPYLKVYNIRNQKIDFDYCPQFIRKPHHDAKMKRSKLVPGMVVLNIVGPPLGKTAIVPTTFPEWNCNQAIAFFRLVGDVLPEYIHLYFCAGLFLRNIELIGTAGQDNISVTKCKNIVIPLPPFAEQKRIVTKVTELLSLCDALEAKLTQAESASTQLLSAAVQSLLNGAT